MITKYGYIEQKKYKFIVCLITSYVINDFSFINYKWLIKYYFLKQLIKKNTYNLSNKKQIN